MVISGDFCSDFKSFSAAVILQISFVLDLVVDLVCFQERPCVIFYGFLFVNAHFPQFDVQEC